jgi:hypothetical protein
MRYEVALACRKSERPNQPKLMPLLTQNTQPSLRSDLQHSISRSEVVKASNSSLIQVSTTSDPVGSLATQTRMSLERFFRPTNHWPSPSQWEALDDLAVAMERIVDGRAEQVFYLSSLDPGIGKTRSIVVFIKALLASHVHQNVGVLLCLSRLEEIRSFVSVLGVERDTVGIVTSDDEINSLGSVAPRRARVLLTTQQMLERRLKGKRLVDAAEFHYKGVPRQLRLWDESILPGEALTVTRDDLAALLKFVRGAHPKVAEEIENMFTRLREAKDGDLVEVPDFPELYGFDLNDIMKIVEQQSPQVLSSASNLWLLAGKTVTVRHDGRYGATILDYRDTLPVDLAPVVVLDASGRVRETYRQWRRGRGNLVELRSATKRYDNLTVHVWGRSGGKGAFGSDERELVDGIASTINMRPTEEWLIVCHKDVGTVRLEDLVKDSVIGDKHRVHFITWGNHHGTNAYANVRNVILAGTLFYRASYYESLARLSLGKHACGGPLAKEEYDATVLGEHQHLVLQAVCRGAVRSCRDGVCAPCDVYLIASTRSGISAALPSIFPGCRVQRWTPIRKALKGQVRDAASFVKDWSENRRLQRTLSFKEVREHLRVSSAQNFRKNILKHPDFQEALYDMSVLIDGDTKFARRFIRLSDLFFVYEGDFTVDQSNNSF